MTSAKEIKILMLKESYIKHRDKLIEAHNNEPYVIPHSERRLAVIDTLHQIVQDLELILKDE